MDGFLLFVIQEANFCSRVLLVPYDAYMRVRDGDYKVLKEHASKVTRDDGSAVENCLVRNMVWDYQGHGIFEGSPWGAAVDALLHRYDVGEGPKDSDKEWSDGAVIVPSTSFDHSPRTARPCNGASLSTRFWWWSPAMGKCANRLAKTSRKCTASFIDVTPRISPRLPCVNQGHAQCR